MAHEIVVDVGRRIVTIRMWAEVTPGEIHLAARELLDDSRVKTGFVQLIDARNVSSVVSVGASDIRAIAASPLDPSSKRAFVTTDPAAFGLARMFATLRGIKNVGEEVGVFRTLEDAEGWLGAGAL